MLIAGIESICAFGGSAYLDVQELAEHRKLDLKRFQNLLMKEKAVALPHEDPVTYGVNAAWPIVDSLPPSERDRIELLIACSESGIDFGKSLSTYIHQYLGLNRNCRLFEIKQACYAATAGLQMAINFVLSQTSPGAKALVVATDISRFAVVEGGESHNGNGRALTDDWSFAEPTGGAGAVALLVSDRPHVFQADIGANGYYGYEVMDTCRPVPDGEAGDADLSLMSYLDCCEQAFLEYRKRVDMADYATSFQYLTFHMPFGGMVKGAHRTMMRKMTHARPAEIESDFQHRVLPGMLYCQRVGNIMGGTIMLSLASTMDHGQFDSPRRIGCFSYGSGCCAEFYSGIMTREGQERQRQFEIGRQLDERYRLNMDEYHAVLQAGSHVKFGTRNMTVDASLIPGAAKVSGRPRLHLTEIREFHRRYEWSA